MKRTNNSQVIASWANGLSATNHKNTLVAMKDGTLYSYSLKIGQRTPSGVCILADYTSPGGAYHSQTTSCHVGLARQVADMVMHPYVWETSPLSNDPYSEIPF